MVCVWWYQTITGTNAILWDLFQDNTYLNTQDVNPEVVFEIYTFEIIATSPRWQLWI